MKNCLTVKNSACNPDGMAGRRARPFSKILLLFAGFTLIFLGSINAQEKSVTGYVVDVANRPLSGVTVTVKGKQVSTQTNDQGEFTIMARTEDVLVLTSVGYVTREISVGPGNKLSITLEITARTLNEVIITGYGTARKKDLTGSIVTVKSSDFQKGVITTPEQLIAGKVPGVSIISNDGRPGSGSTIRIRGGSSLRASNDPLIVIDGVPLDNSGIAGAANPISFINPNDVESFTILKDASAAAIYGTRGSNGVIIITTKKGTGGKLKVNVTSTVSLSDITKKVDVLSPDQFRQIVEANGTAAQIATLGSAHTDWQDVIYQQGIANDNNISLSGGISKLPYRLSIGYATQTGVLKTDELSRTSVALVINPSLFDNHLRIDLNVKGSLEKARFANGGAIGGATSFDPTQPVYSKSDRFGGYYEWLDPTTNTGLVNLVGRNPLGNLEQRFDRSDPRRSIGNLQLDYRFHFLPELHANLNVGYDISLGKGTVFVSDSAASSYIAGGTGGVNNHYKTSKTNKIFDFYLNYAKEFKNISSRIDATAGYSYNNYLTKVYNYPSYYANGTKVPNSDPAFPYNKPEHTLLSYFGRVNYFYKERYLLTATLRRDGSSRFGPDNRWGMFPSVALAWKISDESFLKSSRAVSNLKLRLGYGVTGQQDGINDYDFLSFYALSAPNATYQFGNTYYQMYRPGAYNPNIKWEETATANGGIDFGFINNRITGSIDFYHKKTKDLLNLIPQPAGTNFNAFFIANVGDMENKGIEFSITGVPLRNDVLNWELSYNVTFNKNEISNLTVVPGDVNYRGIQTGGIAGGIGGGFSQIQAVGYAKNTFNLFRQVYNKNGDPQENVFVDKNGDGIINQDDLYKSKSADPDVFMGLTNSFSYKKWSLGFTMRASIGNYTYNNVYSNNGNLNQILGNYVLYNASSNYLETGFFGNSNNLLSDYYIQNASFVRMDNAILGYNPIRIYKDVTLRLSLNVQNVFVITKYKGLDPEVSSGVDNNRYPRPRIYSLSASLDF